MSRHHRSPRLPLALFFATAACSSTASRGGGDGPVEAPAPDAAVPVDVAVEVDTRAPTPLDASAIADAAVADEGSAPGTPDAAAGQYTCTLNATTPYHLGSEHRGYTMFGTVVDTTPGAGGARVGAIQTTLDTNDLVKWVWPGILAKGHTYELAVFEDHLKNRTCMGSATAEPQWLFKIPAVNSDYEFKWVQPVPHGASCQDFPAGAIP